MSIKSKPGIAAGSSLSSSSSSSPAMMNARGRIISSLIVKLLSLKGLIVILNDSL